VGGRPPWSIGEYPRLASPNIPNQIVVKPVPEQMLKISLIELKGLDGNVIVRGHRS
jgi:hypothetical protein